MAKTQQPPVHIIWYKRDLRIHDHAPLHHAAAQEAPVLPLYIVEPSLIHADDCDPSHWTFIKSSLEELRKNLAQLGQPLVVRVGEAVQTFASLNRQVPIAHIWAHEETGNWLTYQRDIAVRRWAAEMGIPLTELPHNGVVRRLKSRDVWEAIRNERMKEPQIPAPTVLSPTQITMGRIPDHMQLRLGRDKRQTQLGGESHAAVLLDSFLQQRGANYIAEMSSPITGADACSRLSPHLAYGTLSVKTAVQATQQRLRELRQMKAEEREALGGRWQSSLKAFESRLAWRDHFMQKLETEPEIEFESFVRSFDGMRPDGNAGRAAEFLEAWQTGQTGYPMIDACMRYVNKTGWLNFRMRAMLVSFAAHDLWLHWRLPALHLARAFLDYEPGIHYSQMQMQSHTTGNSTLRIYDPVKQGLEHDPEGHFVREWVPELAGYPAAYIHAPWGLPREMQERYGAVIGSDYPQPIVKHETAVRHAKERIAQVMRQPETEDEITQVHEKHGSRQRQQPRKKPNKKPPEQNPNQLSLFEF